MVLCAKVNKRNAEQVKRYIINNDLFDESHQYGKDEDHLYFPVKETFTCPYCFVTFEYRNLDKKKRDVSWREAAREVLTDEEHAAGRFGYDTVGAIAIIEIVERLIPKERVLAELLLHIVPAIKTVLKKGGGHEGEYRVQEMIYLAGEDTRDTIVHESGCRFKVNVETMYYSVRLGTERTRIMKLIKTGEHVLCMFSGAAPYPVVFAKNTEAAELVGVEINPQAHKYGRENVALNNVAGKVTLYCGDVQEEIPKLLRERKEKKLPLFDRITMPLPHTGVEFLPVALDAVQPGGVIHYYCFLDKENIEKEKERIVGLVKEYGKKCARIEPVICGQHSPKRHRVCYDMVIE